MRKWLILIGIVLFSAIIGAGAYGYTVIKSPFSEDEEQAVQLVLSEGYLATVNDASYYHGSDAYQVIHGLDEDGEERIVWVGPDDQVISKKASEGISEEDVRAIIERELAVRELVAIRLGVENEHPVYEVTYYDEEGRLSYYYVSFYDGTFIKRYSLRP
ncbi:DUF5590 domain-containing protein [Halalkalibacterium halodurans]|uniref:DUF5590 domain-containing protein n=1 Tax=Halalkalibacterium halodurans TaxID=86665 RepID=A0A0M0KKA2_ALKHA|nr:DUF5590 domain-containing protein [Halalkalibacterium halodurans]TPE70829.1 hypothetical protein AMD02_000080 [Halalkalibacterium halodurans]